MNQQQTPMYEEFQKILNYTQMIVRLFSVTVEVFLRHSFGERYLNIFNCYGAVILLSIGNELRFRGPERYLLRGFIIAFILMCIVHRLFIWRRKKKGMRWHSRYAGTSYDFWKFLPFKQYTIQRYFEPALVFLLGFLVLNISGNALGGWLMISALSLAITAQIDAARFRNQVLDVMDSQIESEYLNAAVVEMKDPSQTEGFSVPVSLNNYSSTQRASFADAMHRVDPALRDIMSGNQPEAPTPNAAELIREQEVKTPSAAELIGEMEEEKLRRDRAEARIKEFVERLRQ